MVEAVYMKEDGSKATQITRKSVREALVNLPEIKGYSDSIEVPLKESLEQQILRHCEDVSSGTITRTDLTNAILKTC